jgi:hypothetical protein
VKKQEAFAVSWDPSDHRSMSFPTRIREARGRSLWQVPLKLVRHTSGGYRLQLIRTSVIAVATMQRELAMSSVLRKGSEAASPLQSLMTSHRILLN